MLEYHRKNIKGRAYFLYYSQRLIQKSSQGGDCVPLDPPDQQATAHTHTPPPFFFLHQKSQIKNVKLWADGQTNLILFFCFFLNKIS